LQTLVRQLHLARGERVLDAGCGAGWLAERCVRVGARVAAMDIALAGVAGVRARFPEVNSLQVGDLYHLPYVSGHFDVVILSEVVEHIEDINAVFREVSRVLKPGGRLLISVPYRETIVDHLCIHCNQLTPANAHLHCFDEAALSDCCRQADLSLRHVHLMANKLLEMAGFPLFSRRWPYWSWRLVDASLNKLLPKPAFMCALAYKRA